MCVVLLAARAWNRIALTSLVYRRRLKYRRGFPGEEVDLEIAIENRKALPLAWLRTRDRWAPEVGPKDESLLSSDHTGGETTLDIVAVMRGFERIRRRTTVLLQRRGVFKIGPAAAFSGDPFGLYQSESLVQPAQHVIVYPQIVAAHTLGLPPDDPFGERKTLRRLFEDHTQTLGVRDYLPGDSLRRVHWPATARTGRLQARVYQPVSGLDLIIGLNAATYPRHWEGTNPPLLEALIRAAASLIMEAYGLGYRVGLISNGSIAHADRPFRIAPSRSRDHLPFLLEALAGLAPLITVPFERFILLEAPRLEYGAGLVAVSALTTEALCESLLRLRARCRRVALLSLADEPPRALPGIDVIHRPFPIEGGS